MLINVYRDSQTGYIYNDNKTICCALCIFISCCLSMKSVPQSDICLPTLALNVFLLASIVRTDRTKTSSHQFMTQCKENTKEEEDEREQKRSTTAREEQGICAALMGESGQSAVSHQREMECKKRTSPTFCKLEKRQLMVNDNFSVTQRQVSVDEHTCNCECPYQDVQFCKLRGHTSKQTLRTASYSIRTDIAWFLSI